MDNKPTYAANHKTSSPAEDGTIKHHKSSCSYTNPVQSSSRTNSSGSRKSDHFMHSRTHTSFFLSPRRRSVWTLRQQQRNNSSESDRTFCRHDEHHHTAAVKQRKGQSAQDTQARWTNRQTDRPTYYETRKKPTAASSSSSS